jgi:hypothetical protein
LGSLFVDRQDEGVCGRIDIPGLDTDDLSDKRTGASSDCAS